MASLTASDNAIPVRYIALLGDVLQRQGVNLPAMLTAANIAPSSLANPDGWLSLEQLDALIPHAIEQTGRSDLALDLGQMIRLSAHSIVGYGILSSPSIEYALRLAARYFSLILPAFRMRLDYDAEHADLSYRPVLPMRHQTLCFLLEVLAAATHCDIEELLNGPMPPYGLFLSYAEPPHRKRYGELTGARCHFGQGLAPAQGPGLRMRFDISLIRRAPTLADASALRTAEERCRATTQRSVTHGKVSDWVSMMLRESSSGMPGLDELAHLRNLSARTLDRHLKREGFGFRDLLKSARHEKACRMLIANRLGITEIALELGYTDAANFTRAFRAQFGLSPSAYRREQLAAESGPESAAGR
tara:strand:- start:1300 stop:2379 length:1080 start_codon:yes stop_codon:yes gene_type:complete